MTCPGDEILLTVADGEGKAPEELAQHVASCERCRERLDMLEASLARVAEGAEALAQRTPASLEARLRWRLKAGATTVRETEVGVLAGWFARHQALVMGSAAVAVLVVLAFVFANPPQSVSAAELLERSQSMLFEMPPSASGLRISYRMHYQGPDFGALPQGSGDYRIEELWDRSQPGSFRLLLKGPDGSLIRAVAQHSDTRRILARTPAGAFDMSFHLAGELPGHDLMEARRRQAAQTVFSVLLRAAAPERLSHSEQEDAHVLELGPPVAGVSPDIPGVFELDAARLVIDRVDFRLRSASCSGRILGEAFQLQGDVASVEPIYPGQLGAADFELPGLEDALVLEGEGSEHPIADVARLLLAEAQARRIPVAQ